MVHAFLLLSLFFLTIYNTPLLCLIIEIISSTIALTSDMSNAPTIELYETIPPNGSDRFGSTECFLPQHILNKIHNFPEFNKVHPTPPTLGIAYEIRPTPDMGLGLFSTREIKMGDVIFSERPLILFTEGMGGKRSAGLTDRETTMTEYHDALNDEERLQKLVDNMSEERRKKFYELCNVYGNDDVGGFGPVSQIVISNGTTIGGTLSDDEAITNDHHQLLNGSTAVCEILSRVNHSCCPNVISNWDTASFSVRVTAARDIAVDEQFLVFYSGMVGRTGILAPSNIRQKFIAPFKFTCTCPACYGDTTRSDAIRLSIDRGRVSDLVDVVHASTKSKAVDSVKLQLLQDSLDLVKDMEREGLYVVLGYCAALALVRNMYSSVGNIAKFDEYSELTDRAFNSYHVVRMKGDRKTIEFKGKMKVL